MYVRDFLRHDRSQLVLIISDIELKYPIIHLQKKRINFDVCMCEYRGMNKVEIKFHQTDSRFCVMYVFA